MGVCKSLLSSYFVREAVNYFQLVFHFVNIQREKGKRGCVLDREKEEARNEKVSESLSLNNVQKTKKYSLKEASTKSCFNLVEEIKYFDIISKLWLILYFIYIYTHI